MSSTLQSSTVGTMSTTMVNSGHNKDTHDGDDRGSWSEVTRRYRPPNPHPQLRSDSFPASSASARQHANRHENVQKKRSKLFDAARSDKNAGIKPAVEIVRKAVIHVDNLDANCTPELLKECLLSNDVSVLSCYETKSWLRDTEKDKVTAFRVCVKDEHRTIVMDANLWSTGINYSQRLEI